MTRSTWDTVWAEVAQAVSRRSSCDRAQVGAVLIKENRVVATGYNGPARGYFADTDQGCQSWCQRAALGADSATAYGFSCPSIHAEANALLHASRWDTDGATLYVTHAPCADCAKLISNSGVAKIMLLQLPEDHRPNPIPYLESCGIEVFVI
jgi:dCMP deaminase